MALVASAVPAASGVAFSVVGCGMLSSTIRHPAMPISATRHPSQRSRKTLLLQHHVAATRRPAPWRRPRCFAARCKNLDLDDEEAGPCRIDEGCIYFVTGNSMKEREVNSILSDVDIPFRVSHVDIDLPELQGDVLQIARQKCIEAAEQVGSAVLVEDTSLCYTALGGMPGPYIKWFVDTIGNDGLYSLLAGHKDHSAYCQCILGFSTGPGAEPLLFVGRTAGEAPRLDTLDSNFEASSPPVVLPADLCLFVSSADRASLLPLQVRSCHRRWEEASGGMPSSSPRGTSYASQPWSWARRIASPIARAHSVALSSTCSSMATLSRKPSKTAVRASFPPPRSSSRALTSD